MGLKVALKLSGDHFRVDPASHPNSAVIGSSICNLKYFTIKCYSVI